jgi:hypothetical protein
MNTIYDNLISKIKEIDTENLTDIVDKSTSINVLDEQKVYFWSRLFLKEEKLDLEIGDDIIIRYVPSGEELKTKFICYAKKGLDFDQGEQVSSYNAEDDKKIICLMIDEIKVNSDDSIPFIRTLFKTGRHYEYQLVRRDELVFILEKNNTVFDYFDVNF